MTDARGRRLPAHVQLSHGRLLISVADGAARYPVRVDPFLQTAELIASDRAAGDNLGASVAVSGNTIVAGSPFHNSGQGAVYVFTEPNGGWSTATQTAELTASDGTANDNLGWSVGVSGDTIVAGAIQYDGGQPGQGAVYVFAEPGGGWTNATQTAELTASDAAANDKLGSSVAVNGPRSPPARRPTPSATTTPKGRCTCTPSLPAAGRTPHNPPSSLPRTAHQPTSSDRASRSAPTRSLPAPATHCRRQHRPGGRVRVHEAGRRLDRRHPKRQLTASDGSAYDALGWSVAVSGDTIAAGAPLRAVGSNTAQGTVYVYAKPGGGWTNATQTAELTASDGAASDQLGSSVSVSDDTITAGAPQRTVGGHGAQGTVYVYAKPGGGWTNATQAAELTASDGATTDELGSSVAISGTTITAAAPRRTNNRGVLYVFSSGLSISTTQQPASATVGSAIADQATVSGGDSPTGTVTFRLYDNPTATGPTLFTDTESLVSGTANSAGYKPSAPGTYYWIATYNGDANNPSRFRPAPRTSR